MYVIRYRQLELNASLAARKLDDEDCRPRGRRDWLMRCEAVSVAESAQAAVWCSMFGKYNDMSSGRCAGGLRLVSVRPRPVIGPFISRLLSLMSWIVRLYRVVWTDIGSVFIYTADLRDVSVLFKPGSSTEWRGLPGSLLGTCLDVTYCMLRPTQPLALSETGNE